MQYQYPAYSGFRCFACNIAFNSFDDQKQHYFNYHSRPINMSHERMNENPISGKKVQKKTVIPKEIRCGFCDVTCSNESMFDFHIKGKKHAKVLAKVAIVKGTETVSKKKTKSETTGAVSQPPQLLYTAEVVCKECDIKCSTMDMLTKHLSGSKHARTIKNKEYLRMVELKDPSVYCENCDLFLIKDLMIIHRSGGKHKRKCNEKAPSETVGKKRKISDGVMTTVEHCGYCLLDLKNAAEAIEHYQSKEHALNCSKAGSNFICEICSKTFYRQDMLDLHFKSFKHYSRVNRGNANPEGEMAARLLKMREKVKEHSKRKHLKDEKDSFISDVPAETVGQSDVNNDQIVAVDEVNAV